MLRELSTGTKISITRSINTTFEQYMNDIKWDEEKFDMVMFMNAWSKYITTQASWYEGLDQSVKESPDFHEELANKINETIGKILAEEPTKVQMDRIEELQKKTSRQMNYSCKAEAKFVIQELEKNS